MRRFAPVLFGALVLVLVAGVWWAPFLDRSRPEIASTPTVRPFATQRLVMLAPGARACVLDVVFDPDAQTAAIQVDARGRPGPPLRVTATAPGYAASGSVPGGYEDGASVVVPLAPAAPRELAGGSVCVANGGRRTIGLVGPGDPRSRNATRVTVAGRPVRNQFSLTLSSDRPSSLAARSGEVLQHAGAFRPVGRGLLWPLAILVLVGVPALVLTALATTPATSIAEREAARPD